MSAQSEADRIKSAIGAFHGHHSGRTFHSGHPEIDPWLRDVLVALQASLNTVSEAIQEIARQIDTESDTTRRLIHHVNKVGAMVDSQGEAIKRLEAGGHSAEQ